MNYRISWQHPLSHLVDIELTVRNPGAGSLELQLPAWRPGRYELQNYAANIKKLEMHDDTGHPVSFHKTGRNRWRADHSKKGHLIIRYQYYACQMDAGGCWLDEQQLYLNFICCMLYVVGREKDPCFITLDIPSDYIIACGLPKEGHMLVAENFHHLADCPMITSASLKKLSYESGDIHFHLWIMGENFVSENKMLEDFKKFTDEQILTLNDFPEKEYHFLFQFLPYRHYHGVEHRNSTVITLGPAEKIPSEKGYSDLVGISSHELFHAWNIIKIRPCEMMPYDFTRENYFRTGFVAEGFTTYYGDLFLLRSGVFSVEEYFSELNTTFKKHFDNNGNYNLSLADSSFDLWIDGYTTGIPDRKVSIYVKGCVAALILDLEIRDRSGHTRSLDDLMRTLWEDFGKNNRGYTFEDIEALADIVAGTSMRDYFEECILGTTDMKSRLTKLLPTVGCRLKESSSENIYERIFGLRTISKDKVIVESTVPGSPAYMAFSREDIIKAVNGIAVAGSLPEISESETVSFTVMRSGKEKNVEVKPDGQQYFKVYTIEAVENRNHATTENFLSWTGGMSKK